MNESIICPEPLIDVPHGSWDTTGTVYYAELPFTCALPCPQIIYTHDEWHQLKDLLFVASTLASIASAVVLVGHLNKGKNHFVRIMFISGFLCNAVIVLLFSALNLRRDDIVCGSNNATFYSQANFCVFQGAATVAAFTWIEYWSVILALDSYLMVRRRAKYMGITFNERKETKKRHRTYLAGAFVTCAFLTFPPLIANNYGFDPRQNVPMCLFLFSTNSSFFWGCFIFPLLIMVSLCAIITVLGIFQMQSIFVNPKLYGVRGGTESSSGTRNRVTLDISARDPLGSDYYMASDDVGAMAVDDRGSLSSGMEQDQGLLFSKSIAAYRQRKESKGLAADIESIQEGDKGESSLLSRSSAQLSTPLVSSGHITEKSEGMMSGGSESTRYSDARLQALLGGVLALEEDDMERDSISMVLGRDEDNYSAPPLPPTHNPLDSRFSTSHAATFADVSQRSRGKESGDGGGEISEHASADSSQGERNSLVSGLSHNSLYRAVATFWTRPQSMGKIPNRDTNVSELTEENLSENKKDDSIAFLQAREDGREIEHGSDENESTKETISLSSGLDTRSSSAVAVKQDKNNKRTDLLRRVVLNAVITQTMRYNGRGLLFVLVYCITTLYIAPVLYVLQKVTYTSCQNSATDFVACLMRASSASIELGIPQTQSDVNAYTLATCGEVPQVRPNIQLVYSGLIWLSGYGIIPALIFGVGSTFSDYLSGASCCAPKQSNSVESRSSIRIKSAESYYDSSDDYIVEADKARELE